MSAPLRSDLGWSADVPVAARAVGTLLDTLVEQVGPRMRVDLTECDEVPRLDLGKRRFVASTVSARPRAAVSRRP